jgi:hypothetical protein
MLFKSLFLQVLPLTLVAAAPLGDYISSGVVGRDAASAESSADSDALSFLVDILQQTLNVASLAIGTIIGTLFSIQRLT